MATSEQKVDYYSLVELTNEKVLTTNKKEF